MQAYVDGVAQTITQTYSDNTASANFGNYILHLMGQSDETVFWPATYLDEVRLSHLFEALPGSRPSTTTKTRQEHLSPLAARIALHRRPLLLVHLRQPLLRLRHHRLPLRPHRPLRPLQLRPQRPHQRPRGPINGHTNTHTYGYAYTGTDCSLSAIPDDRPYQGSQHAVQFHGPGQPHGSCA